MVSLIHASLIDKSSLLLLELELIDKLALELELKYNYNYWLIELDLELTHVYQTTHDWIDW